MITLAKTTDRKCASSVLVDAWGRVGQTQEENTGRQTAAAAAWRGACKRESVCGCVRSWQRSTAGKMARQPSNNAAVTVASTQCLLLVLNRPHPPVPRAIWLSCITPAGRKHQATRVCRQGPARHTVRWLLPASSWRRVCPLQGRGRQAGRQRYAAVWHAQHGVMFLKRATNKQAEGDSSSQQQQGVGSKRAPSPARSRLSLARPSLTPEACRPISVTPMPARLMFELRTRFCSR